MKAAKPLPLWLRFISSYALGLIVLLFMMLLLVLGTLYQAEHGLFRAQRMFYQSYLVAYPVGRTGLVLPLPGAHLLMAILFVNLLAATIFRMKPRLRVIGVYILHAGILVLVGGGFVTAYGSYEGYMELLEGKSANFSTRFTEEELAIIRVDDQEPETDLVTAVYNLDHLRPESVLYEEESGEHGLPFSIDAVQIVPEAVLVEDPEGEFARQHGVNHPSSSRLAIRRLSQIPGERKLLAGIFRVRIPGEEPVVMLLADTTERPTELTVAGKVYQFGLRDRRDYYPFTIALHEFERRTYPGTQVNRSYASEVTLVDPEAELKRDVRIYMNHPLRYRNFTFYQASFGEDDRLSVLQVVKNSGMLFPYIAMVIVTIGLVWQFVTMLVTRAKVQRRLVAQMEVSA